MGERVVRPVARTEPTEVDDEVVDVRKNKRAPGAVRAARRNVARVEHRLRR